MEFVAYGLAVMCVLGLACLIFMASQIVREMRGLHRKFDAQSESLKARSSLEAHALVVKIAEDAIAYAEEQAAARSKRGQPIWSWQDKRDAALAHAKRQAQVFGVVDITADDLVRVIEAQLGKKRLE